METAGERQLVLRITIGAAVACAAFFAAGCASLPKLASKQLQFTPEPVRYREITETRENWCDEARDREVPVTIYAPADVHGKLPVIVFSHGIGEDRDSYAWLGRALARQGFFAVHVTHAGTDRAVLKRGYIHLYRAVKRKENWVNRPLDISFVLDRLAARGDVDTARAAVVGHSAGAFTAFAIAGMRLADGSTYRDRRVKAAVAMSMPRMERVIAPGGFDPVEIPLLNMTGTRDTSIIYRTFPRDRRVPFEQSHAANQYLVTIDGANHDSFVTDDPRHDLIAALTASFLHAWLGDDDRARAWFDEAGRGKACGWSLSVERKRDAQALRTVHNTGVAPIAH